MATISDMPGDEEPEPPRLRFLRRLVYVLTGLLLLAMIVAIVGIAVKLAEGPSGGSQSDSPPYSTLVPLGPGESLVDSHVERGQIYLRIVDSGSRAARVVIIRASNGARVGEVALRIAP